MSAAHAVVASCPAHPVRVYLIDDHPVVRSGLRVLLEAQADMTVVGEAADGASALAGVTATNPDVVVMDLSMPRLSGVEATAWIKAARSMVKVLVLTVHKDPRRIAEVLSAGASGYLLKHAAFDELARAIRSVAAGEQYLDAHLATYVVAPPRAPHRQVNVPLSELELAILRLSAAGLHIGEVAKKLALSVLTVDNAYAVAKGKLGLRSHADLLRYAQRSGWLQLA